MISNYSAFDMNVMHSFEGIDASIDAIESGKAAYMRGRETKNRLSAEKAGIEAIRLHDPLALMIIAASRPFGASNKICTEIYDFIQERSYRRHFPGN